MVFEWARGEKIEFGDSRWMKDREIVVAWGRFFGQFHRLSRLYWK